MAKRTHKLHSYRHFIFLLNSYRTIITDISLTFVPVGPVTIRSPSLEKKLYESLSSKPFSGFNPIAIAFTNVFPSAIAPAASVGPSTPSVLKEATATPSTSLSPRAADNTSSWFLPPQPFPLTVTVVSPLATMAAGFGAGLPERPISLATEASNAPTSLASPSKVEVNINVFKPSDLRY